eukprot:scaffold188278_cov27-Tisochrysis_lutea.AAC.1
MTEAPACKSIDTNGVSPFAHARWSAPSPTLFWASIIAPRRTSKLPEATRPLSAARCSARSPYESAASMSAPARRSSEIAHKQSLATALCKGVEPDRSPALMSAPAAASSARHAGPSLMCKGTLTRAVGPPAAAVRLRRATTDCPSP